MKLIMENPAKYGFRLSSDQLYQPIRTKTVTVNGPVEDWQKWAFDHDINYMILREYNPWIRAKSLPNKTGKTYEVKIPLKEDLNRSTQQKSVYNKNWVID